MHALRSLVFFSALSLAHNIARADAENPAQLSDFQGLTATSFPATYQLISAGLATTNFLKDPNNSVSKSFVQLTLTDSGGTGQRAMIQPLTASYPNDAIRWYGFSIYLPQDWNFAVPVIVGAIDSSNNNLPPPMVFTVSEKGLQLTLHANDRDPISSDNPPTRSNTQKREFILSSAEKGRWHCIAIRVGWSGITRQGETRIWVNGESHPAYDAVLTHNSYQNVTLMPRVGMEVEGALGATQRSVLIDAVIFGNRTTYPAFIQKYMPCPTPAA